MSVNNEQSRLTCVNAVALAAGVVRKILSERPESNVELDGSLEMLVATQLKAKFAHISEGVKQC